MKKRIYWALLISVSSLFLSGCAANQTPSKNTTQSDSPSNPSEKETTTVIPTESETKSAPQTQPETQSKTQSTPQTQPETQSETQSVPQTQPEMQSETQSVPQTQPETQSETQSVFQTQSEANFETELSVQTESPVSNSATLYIGYNGSFQEYDFECGDQASPETLIQGIADLTGWDLSLADSVTTGKGGMTVCFSSQSSLFTGPPEVQKEEFFVYDLSQLASTILGSIQTTLQNYYIDPSLGDPSNFDIYFCAENDQPIVLESLGVTIPIDQPYSGSLY